MLIFGVQFENSGAVLRILCWAAGINFFNIFLNGLFWASNKQNKMIIINVGGLIINVTFNYILIPKNAHIGASFATVGTEFFVFITCIIFALKGMVRITEFKFLFKSLIASVIMGGFRYYQSFQINVMLIILIAATIYLIELYSLK